MASHRPASWLVVSLALFVDACISAPEIYEPAGAYYQDSQLVIDEDLPQIEVGRPIVVLDWLNHRVLSLPTKLTLLNWRLLDHELPEENRKILEFYLQINGMRSVKVRHNQYDPLGELSKLWGNRDVGLPYRATFGLFSWIQYTLFPERVFAGVPLIGGGDHFNPYTNTIHVFSSDLAVILHEAGHAKDYFVRDGKGTWSLLRIVPGVDLMQEAYASTDAIRFLQCIGESDSELRAYRTLIPAYSTYVSGYVGGGAQASFPIVLAGHIVGYRQSKARERGMVLASEGLDPSQPLPRGLFQPEACKAVRESLARERVDSRTPH